MNIKNPLEVRELSVKSFRCFYPILGQSYIFFTDSIEVNRVQGGKYRDLPPMRGIVRMLQSLLGGGGEGEWDYVKFIVKRSKSVSSGRSFRPWQLTPSHPVGN